ncbi:ArsR family transcriptional regulator [Micromonospora sp. NPDC093277]|uniref:ArsR family transcriptional regulator n=1 Tax=Micromonospora sp. NPDC093277 TaxID=3364291 RepID=UPI00381436EA
MIRIELDEPTLARTRIATSPLWEVLTSLYLLKRNPEQAPWPYTAGLAATLGLAPSTVSEHLAALLAAGVAHRRRVGRRVLYGLEPAGLALVTLIGADPATASA